MHSRTIRFFSGEDVRRALPMPVAVSAMKEAFRRLSTGDVVVPPRTPIEAAEAHGTALFMPSWAPGEGRMGVKVITLYEGNEARGLPRIQALMLVLDAHDGRPLAVLEAGTLTAIRTGAASGAATDLLARPDASSVGILGAGVQGRTQLEAVCAVRPIRRARVHDREPERAAAFAGEMAERLGIDVQTVPDAADALRDSDILCSATTATWPVFADADVPAGIHINAIGTYKPREREIPAATVARSRVVVDQREAALEEAGDLLLAIEEGVFRAEDIHAEVGEIVSGKRPGRESDDEITLFKSVGSAIQDLVAAGRILARAEELNCGREVQI